METTRTATQACALAGAVAVMGDGVPAAAAARLAGLAVEDGERAADVLSEVGILAPRRPLSFVHPATRAVLYASLSPGERAIAHRRAVRVLWEAGAAPAAIAVHACSVEPAGDRFVAEALVAAGRCALAAGAPRQAAVLLERALAEPPPPGGRPPARVLLGRALTLLGDRRAPIVTSEALAAAAPHEGPAIATVLVDALWLTGGADAALALACGEPPGIAAARSARDGSLPAGEIVQAAARGARRRSSGAARSPRSSPATSLTPREARWPTARGWRRCGGRARSWLSCGASVCACASSREPWRATSHRLPAPTRGPIPGRRGALPRTAKR